MPVNRQAISLALFNLLASAYPFATADPRLHLPDDVAALAQPSLFLVKPRENITQSDTFGAPKHILKYYAFIIVRNDGVPADPGNTAEAQTDNILTAIENVMSPRPGELQSLGGLVYHCWIDGDVEIDTPVFFEQAAMWIPLTAITGL